MRKIFISISFLFVSAFAFGQSTTITPNNNDIVLTSYSDATAPKFIGRRANLAPGLFTLLNQNILADFGGIGYDGTSFSTSQALIRLRATQTWSSTAHGTRMQFITTPNNSITPATRMTIENDGRININGFTKLGDDVAAPAIKMKELSGNSNTVLSHGLPDLSKIISVSVLIEDALGALTPDGSQQTNFKYSYYVDLSGVHFQFLASPESISVSNRPARVLITYKE